MEKMEKTMPYRIEKGAMERVLTRAHVAVQKAKREEVQSNRMRLIWGWTAAASVALAMLVVGLYGGGEQTPYEELLSQMELASSARLYDMSVEFVEYESDINLL